MKMGFFPRLAWTGITKNRKLYLPYILSCIGMVMMFYILQSLSYSPLLREMRGGRNIELVLTLGKFVIAVFALIFLFYTNSFLIRRRNKEFGLYNILGMDKRGIGRVIAWESLIVSLLGLAGGLAGGIAFSKLAELGLANIVHAGVDYRFTFSAEGLALSAEIFGVIFLLLFLRSLWQVRRSDPLELLHSENTGEKPPKGNRFLALLGAAILIGAYYIAVSIQQPLLAILLFFVAVIMVIVATYLLFVSGSVTLCRRLQQNKGYYYQKQHFISTSSMVYRMKRNGAGLASICILSTMVLVMISSTSSLYIGAEDCIDTRYPRGTEIAVDVRSIDNFTEEKISQLRTAYEKVFADHGVQPENLLEYRYVGLTATLSGIVADPSGEGAELVALDGSELRQIYFISAADYNRATGASIALEPGQAMLSTLRCKYQQSVLNIGDVSLAIVGTLEKYPSIGEASASVAPVMLLVIPDYETLRPLDGLKSAHGYDVLNAKWYYGYDLTAEDQETIAIYEEQTDCIGEAEFLKNGDGYGYSSGCIANERNDFYTTYGGLFFLGIVLSIIFTFAAVMIIYYKQISEGYEDHARFAIMRKVGMTREDIRKSINSQVLTVFFAPLLAAGLHLAFAFPLVWKILQLFQLQNLKLAILTNVGAYLIFALFYALVYKITAGAYYAIVSSDGE